MDNINNDNNYDKLIRPPDQVKKDILIDDDFDNNNNNKNPIWNNKDYDINTLLEISKNEFDSVQEEEENKAIELICNQIKEQQNNERQNKFNNIKIQLNKIILFDRNNLEYYELVLSIIEMYELGFINDYKTHNIEYTNIFRILKTIRLPVNEFDNLKNLIICE